MTLTKVILLVVLCFSSFFRKGVGAFSLSSRSNAMSRGRPQRSASRLEAAAASSTSTTTTPTNCDEAVCRVLELARQFGPIGSLQSPEDQERLLTIARELSVYSDPQPARKKFQQGQPPHCLIYSNSQGGSSGLMFGKVYGKVTQTFNNETCLINAVEWGPVRLSLSADLTVKDDWNTKVNFRLTTVRLFGQTLLEKAIQGAGIWKYLFAGVVRDNQWKQRLVRIIETPSLFILTQDLDD